MKSIFHIQHGPHEDRHGLNLHFVNRALGISIVFLEEQDSCGEIGMSLLCPLD